MQPMRWHGAQAQHPHSSHPASHHAIEAASQHDIVHHPPGCSCQSAAAPPLRLCPLAAPPAPPPPLPSSLIPAAKTGRRSKGGRPDPHTLLLRFNLPPPPPRRHSPRAHGGVAARPGSPGSTPLSALSSTQGGGPDARPHFCRRARSCCRSIRLGGVPVLLCTLSDSVVLPTGCPA